MANQQFCQDFVDKGKEGSSVSTPGLWLPPHFASFLSGGFTSMAVINQLDRKLAKRISMHCGGLSYQKSMV
jgi:hypothetical protein